MSIRRTLPAMPLYATDSAEERRQREARHAAHQAETEDRERDAHRLACARAYHGVDRLVRCTRCWAAYERYPNHHGRCQDCH